VTKKTKKVMRHPPKDKKINRPRSEPTQALTEEARLLRSRRELAKAKMHLQEALFLAETGSTPHACVHSSYYAMRHCARAALLNSGGVGKSKDVPASHEHVIQHFGKLAGDENNPDSLGLLLNRARGERITSDYDLEDSITEAQASEAAAKATHFVEECIKRWNLQS
jgi:uncharacterized protein (UPF0332 family)